MSSRNWVLVGKAARLARLALVAGLVAGGAGLLLGGASASAEPENPVVLESSRVIRLPALDSEVRHALPVGDRFAVQAGDHTVALVDPVLGRIMWVHQTQGPIRHFGLDAAGHVIVAAADLTAFEAEEGTVHWFYPLVHQKLLYVDDEIALLSGFGDEQPHTFFNGIRLIDGAMLWPDWVKLGAVQSVEVAADSFYVHADDRPGWAYTVDRASGSASDLEAVSLADLPVKPEKWQVDKKDGQAYVYRQGEGAVLPAADVDFVIEHDDTVYVLAVDSVRTFEPASVAGAMATCSTADTGAAHAKCLGDNVTLTEYMGAPGAGFRAAVDALVAGQKSGKLTTYQAVESLQLMIRSMGVMSQSERSLAVDRMVQFAGELAKQGDHLQAFKLYDATTPFARHPWVKEAAVRERCMLLHNSPARCGPRVR